MFKIRMKQCSLRRLKLSLLVVISLSVSCYFFVTKFLAPGLPDPDFRLKEGNGRELIVLYWTPVWRKYKTPSPSLLSPENCTYLPPSGVKPRKFNIPCKITYDRRYFDWSDAVVFHSWDVTRELQGMPERRRDDQIWIYIQHESPIHTRLNLRNYQGVFNWTMTYRRDSDVYSPYGHVVSKRNSFDAKNGVISLALAQRPKLVAWIVSSCTSHSRRENFVHELEKHIPVSIFGMCGEECHSETGSCFNFVAQSHKFYLSFENSLCLDYITEKFFKALRENIVPVVYGGISSEDYSRIAPEGSYIDARGFRSAKHLAEYLLYLDRNDEAYMKYFEWKKAFQVIDSHPTCSLCQKVFENSNVFGAQQKKCYQNLWTWWNYLKAADAKKQDSFLKRNNPESSAVISKINSSGYMSSDHLSSYAHPICHQPISSLTMSGGKFAEVDYESRNTIFNSPIRKLRSIFREVFN